MTLEKGDPGSLEEWETVVGDDFSLYYDSYSVDERVDSDSKVRGSQPPSRPVLPHVQGSLSNLSCPTFFSLSFSEHPLTHCPILSVTYFQRVLYPIPSPCPSPQ